VVTNKNSKENLKTILQENGMKYTEQRAIILELLLTINKHLSADQLFDTIKKKYPEHNIGIATIYRTLNFLEEVNLISSISFGKDGKRYEKNDKNQHHDHIICTSCGKIVEFLDLAIEQKQQEIAKSNGFKITDHTMQIFGICKECQLK